MGIEFGLCRAALQRRALEERGSEPGVQLAAKVINTIGLGNLMPEVFIAAEYLKSVVDAARRPTMPLSWGRNAPRAEGPTAWQDAHLAMDIDLPASISAAPARRHLVLAMLSTHEPNV